MRSLFGSFRRAAKPLAIASSTRKPVTPARSSPAMIEGLEPREMMSATIDGGPWCGTGIHHPVIHPPVVIVVVHHV